MQKRIVYFLVMFLILAFTSCKQNELNFDEEDANFFIRSFSIKAIDDDEYMNVSLEKLKDGNFQFTSPDEMLEVRFVSNIAIKTAIMDGAVVKIDEKTKKIIYAKSRAMGVSFEDFKIELLANNGMTKTLKFKACYAKNHIRGLKVKLDENIYSINDLANASLEVLNDKADIEVIAKDSMTRVELKDEIIGSFSELGFVDEKKKCAKGKIENISDVSKKITLKIEAKNRDEANVEFNLKKLDDALVKNITLRSLEYFDKSPFNLDKTKFTKDVNGIYASSLIKFSDWDGLEVLFIVQPEDEKTEVKYSYSDNDVLPTNFVLMPKKYVYSKWNNSGGVAPNDYLSLKDVFNIKRELKHGKSYLFLSFENSKTKAYYKIPLEREKENVSLCEFIKLSPRRVPIVDYYDAEGRQPSLSSNGIHEIVYIFKLKNPRGSIKFYASTRDGRKEIEAKKITKGEYKSCYSIEINPLKDNSETYCEAYAVAEDGRVAKSDTDPKGVYTLSLNNIFLSLSYEDDKDKYKYPSMPNYIKFDRSKIVDNKLFVRVIVPNIYKNDLETSSIQPTPTVTDLPSNMSKYSAYFTAYKLTIDVSTLTKGKELDIAMPIKNTDTNRIIFTHLVTVEEE